MAGYILISSSDLSLRQEIVELFAHSGITARTVGCDMDLLLEILKTDYPLAIYDLGISHVNGLKTVQIIRRIRPKLSLVVLSIDPSRKLGGQLLQEGVAYYDFKPINPAAFCRIVLNTLN